MVNLNAGLHKTILQNSRNSKHPSVIVSEKLELQLGLGLHFGADLGLDLGLGLGLDLGLDLGLELKTGYDHDIMIAYPRIYRIIANHILTDYLNHQYDCIAC